MIEHVDFDSICGPLLTDFKGFLSHLFRQHQGRKILEEYAGLLRKGQRVKARKSLVKIYDMVILHAAMTAPKPQDRIRASEVGLVFAGEKPAEKVEHSGTLELWELAIEGAARAKQNGHRKQTIMSDPLLTENSYGD